MGLKGEARRGRLWLVRQVCQVRSTSPAIRQGCRSSYVEHHLRWWALWRLSHATGPMFLHSPHTAATFPSATHAIARCPSPGNLVWVKNLINPTLGHRPDNPIFLLPSLPALQIPVFLPSSSSRQLIVIQNGLLRPPFRCWTHQYVVASFAFCAHPSAPQSLTAGLCSVLNSWLTTRSYIVGYVQISHLVSRCPLPP